MLPEKEKHVKRITDQFLKPLTGYGNLIVPGTNLWIEYSDETQEKCVVNSVDTSCIDNSLTGQTEVVIRLKLQKGE